MERKRYDSLIQLSQEGRQEAKAFAERFLKQREYRTATMNLWSAAGDAVSAAHTEWRLGAGDPSPYLRDAIGDARDLAKYFDKVTGLNDRSANMMAIWDAMYAQLLLDQPIDQEFRRCCQISPEEKRCPAYFKEYWIHPWDALVFELVETGNTPAEWDDFVACLANKHGGRTLLKTMQAYRQLIDSARADDPHAAARAVAAAEKCFKARRNMTLTWGGGDLSEQTADHRLACAIKQAERIRPGITASIDTPHRWRWL